MKRSHKVVKTVVKSVAKPDSMTVVKHIVVEQTVVKQLVVRQIVVKFQWSSSRTDSGQTISGQANSGKISVVEQGQSGTAAGRRHCLTTGVEQATAGR